MDKTIERTCKYCGITFLASVSDVKRGLADFCSKICEISEPKKRYTDGINMR